MLPSAAKKIAAMSYVTCSGYLDFHISYFFACSETGCQSLSLALRDLHPKLEYCGRVGVSMTFPRSQKQIKSNEHQLQ